MNNNKIHTQFLNHWIDFPNEKKSNHVGFNNYMTMNHNQIHRLKIEKLVLVKLFF